MAPVLVIATLTCVAALVAVLVTVGLRIRHRGGRAPLTYLVVLSCSGLLFGLVGLVTAVVAVGR